MTHDDMNSGGQLGGAPGLLQSMWAELRAEIETLGNALPTKDPQGTRFPDPADLSVVQRRILVRSIAAFIEALTFSMKALALESNNADALSGEERMVALERVPELTDAGTVESRPAKLRTLSNIRYGFNLLAKVDRAEFQLDVSGEGWSHLRATLAVRDRVAHPKTLEDLNVSDHEARRALCAFIWFEGQLVVLILKVLASTRRSCEDMRGYAKWLERSLVEGASSM